MKGDLVVDSSVGIAWTVPSQSTDAARGLLDEIGSGSILVVPALWMLEVANTLLVLTRRKRITREECLRARRALGELNPTFDHDGYRLALGEISLLAEKYGLSIYDAVYLELAIRRGLPLASRDAALNKAAKLSGVRTLLREVGSA